MTPFMKIEMFETKNHWTFMTIDRIRGYPKTLILGVIKGGGPPTSYKCGYGGPYKWPNKWVTGVKTLVRGVISPYLQLIEVPPSDSYLALNVSIAWPKDDTVDGQNPAPLRMLEMLVLSQYQEVFGHPKWCRIFFHQPYESICTVCICLYFPADTNSFCFALFTGFSGPIT